MLALVHKGFFLQIKLLAGYPANNPDINQFSCKKKSLRTSTSIHYD